MQEEPKTTNKEKAPCCQRCGKLGFFSLSGICDECEIEEISEALNDQE